jgi:DnaJ-class molecular chaperone
MTDRQIKRVVCSTCQGDGYIYPLVKQTCEHCSGQAYCNVCAGAGYIYEPQVQRCEPCRGYGVIDVVPDSKVPG